MIGLLVESRNYSNAIANADQHRLVAFRHHGLQKIPQVAAMLFEELFLISGYVGDYGDG